MSQKISSTRLNADGQEVLDNTPVNIPLRFQRVKNLSDQIRETLRSEEFRAYLNSQELETPEEADDFDVGDDYDPRSPYEMTLDQELRGPQDDENERVAAAQRTGNQRSQAEHLEDEREDVKGPRREQRVREAVETRGERVPRRNARVRDGYRRRALEEHDEE